MAEGKKSKTSSGGLQQFEKELFKDDSDSSDAPECDLCGKEFGSVKSYQQHLNGQKHHKMQQKEKMKKKSKVIEDDHQKALATNEESGSGGEEEDTEELFCEVCKTKVYGHISYYAHLKGQKHTKNEKARLMKHKLRNVPGVINEQDENKNSEDDDEDMPKPFATCVTCKKTFYDPGSFKRHIEGPNHKKKCREQKISEKMRGDLEDSGDIKCDDCEMGFSSFLSLKMHQKGEKHAKKLRRAKLEKELEGQFDKDEDGNLLCKECKKSFSDPAALKEHLKSDSHEKQKALEALSEFVTKHPEITAVKTIMKTNEDDEEEEIGKEDESYMIGRYFLTCALCHTAHSGVKSAHDHVKSKSHQNRLEEKQQRKKLAAMMKIKKKEANGPVKIAGRQVAEVDDDDFEVIEK